MLDICLDVEKINHQACVETLLPMLVEHCAAKTHPNELDRYLAELGSEAVPAASSLLQELDAKRRDQLVVWLAAAHEERMRNSANRHLQEWLGAPIIHVGQFGVCSEADGLALMASQVLIDYPELLRSPLVEEGIGRLGGDNAVLKSAAAFAVRLGAKLPPDRLEKQSVALLKSERVKKRLIAALQEAARHAGLDVTLGDMSVEQVGPICLPENLSASGEPIPDAYANELLDALTQRAKALRAS